MSLLSKIYYIPPHERKRWSDERVDELKRLWRTDKTYTQIAEALTGVTTNAVVGKCNRLGLQRKPRR